MKILVTLLLSCFTVPLIHGQNTLDVKKEIIALEHAFAKAIQSRDTILTKAFQDESYYLAFTVDSMPVQIVPRQSWLNVLEDYVTHSFSIDDIHVNVYDNVAVAMLMFTQNATVRGKDRSGQFVLTDIWINKGGRWLIAERHSSRPGRNANMKSK